MEQSYMYTAEKSKRPYASLPDILRETMLERPNQEAVIFYSPDGERSSITFSELYTKCELFAKGLVSLGFEKGDVIAMSCRNCPEWLICTFGIQMAGFTPLYLSPQDSQLDSTVNILQSIGRCAMFIHDRSNVDVLSRVLQDISTFNMMLSIKSINSIYEHGKSKQISLPKLSPDDVCGIFFTSGSTGMPKAIPHTHLSLYQVFSCLEDILEVKPGEKFYYDIPFNSVGSFPLIFLTHKVILITVTNIMEIQSPSEMATFTLSVLEKEHCVSTFLISPCIYDLLERAIPCSETFPLRTIWTDGQPIDRKCAQIIGPLTRTFVTGYGCSEFGYICKVSVSDPMEYDNYEVGRPVKGVEAKIVDDNGVIVPVGTAGKIYVRGRQSIQGYMNVSNISKCDKAGWYNTDDVGFINEKGNLVVFGRKSDVMIIDGRLMSPSYVESVLKNHSSVENACLFPIHKEDVFHEAYAAIVLRKDMNATEKDLKKIFFERKSEYTEGYLENLSVPSKFLFLDTFPKTDSGKVDRKALKFIVQDRLKQLEETPTGKI